MKDSDPLTFRHRFCKAFGCDDRAFEREALRWFLHRPWRALSDFIIMIDRDAFRIDRQILNRIGDMDDFSQIIHEIRDIRMDYQRARDFGFSRRHLRRRLSSERILTAAREFWNKP